MMMQDGTEEEVVEGNVLSISRSRDSERVSKMKRRRALLALSFRPVAHDETKNSSGKPAPQKVLILESYGQ